jgi:hypothetical protein
MREAVGGEEEDLEQQLRERERDDDDDDYDVLRFALTLILDFDDDVLRFALTVILDFDDDVLGFALALILGKSIAPPTPSASWLCWAIMGFLFIEVLY